ncbi:MAG TPA: hypothetical protein VGR62_16915 [Candidatus Binatia bacterium]|jgi:hypothetical protein|nr:hypothetical protein [Candidatus Binatia bacterium]
MTGRIVTGMTMVAALTVIGVSGVRAESKGCEKIVAAAEESGGGISADELAKKTNTDVETVRNCLDAAAKPAKPADGTAPKH